jgi:hypothetical protein
VSRSVIPLLSQSFLESAYFDSSLVFWGSESVLPLSNVVHPTGEFIVSEEWRFSPIRTFGDAGTTGPSLSLIIGICCGFVFLVCGLVIVCVYQRRRRAVSVTSSAVGSSHPDDVSVSTTQWETEIFGAFTETPTHTDVPSLFTSLLVSPPSNAS